MTVALAVIAKAPVPGRVKTRLCPPCTPAEAARIAEAALADTLDAVARTSATRRICVLDGEPGPWLPEGFEVIPQSGGGLDERLAAAFDAVAAPLFLVGMDTPQLTPALLDHATAALVAPGIDAVLGHTHDGGYWGVGLHRSAPELFVGVPMSQDDTGICQARRLREHGLVLDDRLPMLRDVDTMADAYEVAANAPATRFAVTVATVGETSRSSGNVIA